MANISLNIAGRMLTSSKHEDKKAIYKELGDGFSKSLKEHIHIAFDRSIQLAAYVGNMTDQEVVRAMLRSLIVSTTDYDPIRLEAKFDDKYAHLYGGGKLPDELSKIIQDLIDNSIKEWLSLGEGSKILNEVLSKP